MAFRVRASHLVALAITAGIAGWMYTGEIIVGGQPEGNDKAVPIAEREAENSSELFKVRFVTLQPEQRIETISVRGRTKADAIISVRSEAAGVVEKRLVNKGDRVTQGDLLCVVERGVKLEQLAQAKAQLAQAEADHTANSRLAEQGFAA